MVDLNGHEAGNGGHSQGKPTAYRDSSTRRRDARGVYLPELVVAEFFFEARRGGGDGSNPVRLLGLRLVDSGKPVGEVAFLGAGSRSGG